MEIMTVLVLSTIVVTLAYYTLNMISRQYFRYQQYQENLTGTLRFYGLLQREVNASNDMKLNSRQLILRRKAREIIYAFEEDFVIRRQGENPDTFYVTIENIQYLPLGGYEGIELTFLNKEEAALESIKIVKPLSKLKTDE